MIYQLKDVTKVYGFSFFVSKKLSSSSRGFAVIQMIKKYKKELDKEVLLRNEDPKKLRICMELIETNKEIKIIDKDHVKYTYWYTPISNIDFSQKREQK